MVDMRTITLELRHFRDMEAKRQGVEGYKVLQNETIDLIAEIRPETNLELLQIKGIGATKAKKYGETILRIVKGTEEEKNESGQKVYSVGEFLYMLNSALEKKVISIRGEITECDNKSYASYVTLKDSDEQALLKCYVPKRAIPQGVELEEGMEIVVTGHPHVHKVYNFALQVHSVLLTGEGVLLKALEELKKKLAIEGLFEEERKSSITPFVRTIGLITSPGSDAERDVVTHLGSWGMNIRCLGVHVEGVRAVSEIVASIRWFNSHALDTDVIILTRGGGSLESLQAFNSEAVARAIFSSKIPIICAVGHERDVSVADMVADLRVSTPTAAGRFVSERWGKVEERLDERLRVFSEKIGGRLELMQAEFSRFNDRFEHTISYLFEKTRSEIRRLYRDMHIGMRESFELFRRLETEFSGNRTLLGRSISEVGRLLQLQERDLSFTKNQFFIRLHDRLTIFEEKLSAVNPELKLKQGYSIAFNVDGKVIQSIRDVDLGDVITTRLSDGEVTSEVEFKK